MGFNRILRYNESDCWSNQFPLFLQDRWDTVSPRPSLDFKSEKLISRLGAGIAALFYTLFPDNPIVLPILGWAFSLPCFYVITQMPDYGQASRFTLLAYVSCVSLLMVRADE